MTLTTIGNGTILSSSQQINTTVYNPYNNEPITYTGTLYSLTAVPNAGAQLDRWEYHVHDFRRVSDDSGSTWRTLKDVDYDDTTYGNPYTYTPTYVYPGDWQMALLEGKRVENGIPIGTTYIFEDYFTDQSISCYFTGGHIPTHIIIRDDATGMIMRGGTQNNKILRDD